MVWRLKLYGEIFPGTSWELSKLRLKSGRASKNGFLVSPTRCGSTWYSMKWGVLLKKLYRDLKFSQTCKPHNLRVLLLLRDWFEPLLVQFFLDCLNPKFNLCLKWYWQCWAAPGATIEHKNIFFPSAAYPRTNSRSMLHHSISFWYLKCLT